MIQHWKGETEAKTWQEIDEIKMSDSDFLDHVLGKKSD